MCGEAVSCGCHDDKEDARHEDLRTNQFRSNELVGASAHQQSRAIQSERL